MNYLCNNEDDSAAESAHERRCEHHLDTTGEHRHEPGSGEGKWCYEQHPLATEAHGKATQHAAEEGAQKWQTGDPGRLLLADREDPAGCVGHGGRETVLLLLEGVYGWRAVPLTEAGGEGTQRHCECSQDLWARKHRAAVKT